MSSEMQNLVKALEAQTAAINKLAESNVAVVNLMIQSLADEAQGDEDYAFDLSGKPIVDR